MKNRILTATLAGFLLAGCAGTGERQAAREEITTTTAVVEHVDQKTRVVDLRAEDGTVVAVTAGPEVRNFDQIAPGDRLTVDYYRSVAVAMADPEAAPEPSDTLLAGRSPKGDKPGGVAVATTDFVVDLLAYNPESGLATIVTPSGETLRITVAPEMRSFAETLKPGNRVRVTLTQAVAVIMSEAPTT